MAGHIGPNRDAADEEPTEFDEVIETPFGFLARKGRFILAQNLMTEEEMATYREVLRDDSLPELEERLRELHKELIDLLRSMDPLEMLMQFAIPYLAIDPDTYREWETDRHASHVEYLAMQVLALPDWEPNAWTPQEMNAGLHRMEELLKEIFNLQMHRHTLSIYLDSTIEGVAADLRRQILLHSLTVRIHSYAEHEIANLRGVFEPLDDLLQAAVGFTISDAIAICDGIGQVMMTPLNRRLEVVASQFETDRRRVKAARRKPHREKDPFFESLASLTPSEAKHQLQAIGMAWAFFGSKETFALEAEEVADQAGVTSESVRSFLDVFSSDAGLYDPDHHQFPSPTSPLLTRPLFQTAEGWLCPIPAYLLYAVRPRLEEVLLESGDHWDRYSAARGTYLEHAAGDMIAKVLGEGAEVWERIEWKSTESDEAGEIDVLARQDVVGIRVQCKGGRFTAPARRGGLKRMDTEFRELVGDAAEQHERLAIALERDQVVLTNPNPEVMHALTELPLQFEMIVTMEDLGLFGAQMFLLEEFGTLNPTVRLPYLVSINDLRVITDVLDGPEFVHYLARRERLNRIRRVFAQDELDYLGNYLSDGLYFDDWASDDPDGYFRLLSFTEEFDSWYFARDGVRTTDAPKPTRKISQQGKSLIAALKTVRPPGWLVPCMAIHDWSSESQDQFDLQWKAALARARDKGESSTTFEFWGKYRFTVAFGLDANLGLLKERLAEGQSRKIKEGGFPLGISVGRLPPPNAYTVALTSEDLPRGLERAFLEPELVTDGERADEEE